MISEPKLDPCPFCGHKEITYSRYNGSLYCYCGGCKTRGIAVQCLTADSCACHPNPNLEKDNEDKVNYALQKVAEAWNKRV